MTIAVQGQTFYIQAFATRLSGMQDESSVCGLFDSQLFQRQGGRSFDRDTVPVETGPVAGAGECINLNLDGTTEVGAHQAYGSETGVILNEDGRDLGYRCR